MLTTYDVFAQAAEYARFIEMLHQTTKGLDADQITEIRDYGLIVAEAAAVLATPEGEIDLTGENVWAGLYLSGAVAHMAHGEGLVKLPALGIDPWRAHHTYAVFRQMASLLGLPVPGAGHRA